MAGITTNYITDLGDVFVSYADLVANQPIATLHQAKCGLNTGAPDAPILMLNLYAPTATAQTIQLQDTHNNMYGWFVDNNFIIYAKPGYTITLTLNIETVNTSSYTTNTDSGNATTGNIYIHTCSYIWTSSTRPFSARDGASTIVSTSSLNDGIHKTNANYYHTTTITNKATRLTSTDYATSYYGVDSQYGFISLPAGSIAIPSLTISVAATT